MIVHRANWAVYRTAAGLHLAPSPDGETWTQAILALDPNAGVCKASTGPAMRVADICVVPTTDPATYFLVEQAAAPAPSGTGGMAVQSLLFPKDKWTAATAAAWIASHDDFADNGADETDQYLRYRQADPSAFTEGSLRTIDFGQDIRAIVGRPKAAKGIDVAVAATNDRLVFDGVQLLKVDATESENDDDDEADDDEPEERYVLSVVMEPNDGTEGAPLDPDAEGDIQSAAAIRKAAHRWMEHGGQVDLNHSWKALGQDRVRVLESYLAPCDVEIGGYAVRKGTWLLGLRIADDAMWTAVKGGEIGAYSIGGSGQRLPVETPNA